MAKREYLTTVVHLNTSITMRHEDEAVNLRVSPAGVAFRERGNEADPALGEAILEEFRQMPEGAGWLVTPWREEWGEEPGVIPLYRLDPASASVAAVVADSEARIQAKDADLATANARIAELERELATVQGQLADVVRGQALQQQQAQAAPAPMIENAKPVPPKAAPKAKGAKGAKAAEGEDAEGEAEQGRQPVLAQTDPDALEGIPQA